jgi:hypothetical protein
MAIRFKRGVGDTVPWSPLGPCTGMARIFDLHCWGLFPAPQSVAPPQAPTGDVLTVPPADGEQAQATVDALINQQMRDQQALDASRVTSSWVDRFATSAVEANDAVTFAGISPLVWIAAGLGVVAMVAFGGGSPRRYGR